MIQLSKPRSFGEYFSDTIDFLKQNGKHFFSNFFRLAGIPLILIIGIGYFAMSYFFDRSLSLVNINTPNTFPIPETFEIWTFGLLFVVFILILFLAQMFLYAFTPIYLMLYKEYGTRFDFKDIWATYRSRLGKIFKFSIGMIAVSIVLAIPIIITLGIMIITIVGILAIPLLLGFLMLSLHNAYMEYLNTDAGFMYSVQFGFKLSRIKFWHNVGAATLFYFLVSTIVNILIVIPYYIYLFVNMATNLSDPSDATSIVYGKVTILYYLVSIVSSIIVSSINQVNFGIIYYSNIEENTNNQQYSEIDTIGNQDNV